jgi:hypothetical protein
LIKWAASRPVAEEPFSDDLIEEKKHTTHERREVKRKEKHGGGSINRYWIFFIIPFSLDEKVKLNYRLQMVMKFLFSRVAHKQAFTDDSHQFVGVKVSVIKGR